MSIAELLIEATLFFLISPSMALYFLIGCAPLSGMIFLLSRNEFKTVKKYTGAESLLIVSAVSITVKIIMLVVFWLFTGKNILLPDSTQLQEVLAALYGSQPELQAVLAQMLGIFPYMMPAMIVIYCAVEAFMNYSLCHRFIRKLFPKCENYPPEISAFTLWRFPVSLMLVSVVSLIMSYFIKTEEYFAVSMFVMNLQIIVNIFMFIEGASLALWIMSGFKLRRGIKIVICVIMSIPFFWPWLIVMGMCDMVLNMRERIKFGA